MVYLLCTTDCLCYLMALTHPVGTLGKFNTDWATKQHQCLDFFHSTQLVQVNHCIVTLFLYFSALLKWTLESKKTEYCSSEPWNRLPPSMQKMWCFMEASHLFSSQLHPVNSQALWTSEIDAVWVSEGGESTTGALFSPSGAQEGLTGKLHMNMALSGKLLVKKNSTIQYGACPSNADKDQGATQRYHFT